MIWCPPLYGTGWLVSTPPRICSQRSRRFWWTSSGTDCTGFRRLFCSFLRRREDRDWCICPAGALLSGSSSSRGCCMDRSTWCGGLWLSLSCSVSVVWDYRTVFLMDFKTARFHTLPGFYRGLFTVWRLLLKQRAQHDSVLAAAGAADPRRTPGRPLLGGSNSHGGFQQSRDFNS